MWIAHYASALAAKPFASGVPLSILALASALSDATFFSLNLLGFERWSVDSSLVRKGGCFPYHTEYPYSHSLLGMAVIGVLLAGGYTALSHRKVTLQDQLTIVLLSMGHFLFEIPAHRTDVKITPHDNVALGSGLFDHPFPLFILESAIFLAGMYVYTTYAPPIAKAGYKTSGNEWKLWAVTGFMIVQQAHFCFGAAPTTETRWVHAPLFLFEILFSSWALGKLEA